MKKNNEFVLLPAIVLQLALYSNGSDISSDKLKPILLNNLLNSLEFGEL